MWAKNGENFTTNNTASLAYSDGSYQNIEKFGYFKKSGNTNVFFPASGNRSDYAGTLFYTGSYGYYWSSSPSNTNVYRLWFVNGSIDPVNIYYRTNGYPVRCVVDK